MKFKEFLLLRESDEYSEMSDAVWDITHGRPVDPRIMEQSVVFFHDDSATLDSVLFPQTNKRVSNFTKPIYKFLQSHKLQPELYCNDRFIVVIAESNLKKMVENGMTISTSSINKSIGKVFIPLIGINLNFFVPSRAAKLLELFGVKKISGKALDLALLGAKVQDILFAGIKPPETDYRPNEMTPEDFY